MGNRRQIRKWLPYMMIYVTVSDIGATKQDWLMEHISRGKVSAGRVVLPAELRKAFGIKDGSEVIFTRTEHGIEIKTLDEVVKQAQQLCAQYITPGVSLVDELRKERDRDESFV
jgi:AbrB family looped-hinge helix DNA binding protein